MDISSIPKEVVIEHVLPYLGTKELYLLRSDTDYSKVFSDRCKAGSPDLLDTSIQNHDGTLLLSAIRSLTVTNNISIISPFLRCSKKNSQTGYVSEELIGNMFQIALEYGIGTLCWIYAKFPRLPILQDVLVKNKNKLCSCESATTIIDVVNNVEFYNIDYSQIIWDDDSLLVERDFLVQIAFKISLPIAMFRKYLEILEDQDVLMLLEKQKDVSCLIEELFNNSKYHLILCLLDRKLVDFSVVLDCYQSWITTYPLILFTNQGAWEFLSQLRKVM